MRVCLLTVSIWFKLASGLEISWRRDDKGSLEFSCGSLKFLQGAQRCTGFYTQHLKLAFLDAIGVSGKKKFKPLAYFDFAILCTKEKLQWPIDVHVYGI